MKSGKTTLASEIDKVFIAEFELGAGDIHNILRAPMNRWNDWKQVVKQAVVNKDQLKSKIEIFAIDTIDEAYKLCEKYICQKNNVSTIGDIPYGCGYKLLDEEFMSTFRELAYAGYGLFFISHSTEKTFKNDEGEEYTQIAPALPNRPYNLINKMVDSIVYLREVVTQKEGKKEKKRFLFFRGDDRFLAGSRLKYIAPYVELSYKNLIDTISNAVEEEIKHKGGEAGSENNPYEHRDFDTLIDEAKQIWGKVVQEKRTDEALKILEEEFGKPTKFSEILPEQIDQLTNSLIKIKELV